MSKSQFDKYNKAIARGDNYVDFLDSEYQGWMREKENQERINTLLKVTVANNNLGIKHEKEGNLAKAIEAYERNIALGYPAFHSFNRLAILYKKLKRIEDEIRILNVAIQVFTPLHPIDAQRFLERLNKIK